MYLSIELPASKVLFFLTVGLYAGLCLPLFSLNLAHTNDFVPKEKFVAAGGGLQFIFGIGALIAPLIPDKKLLFGVIIRYKFSLLMFYNYNIIVPKIRFKF